MSPGRCFIVETKRVYNLTAVIPIIFFFFQISLSIFGRSMGARLLIRFYSSRYRPVY